MEWGKFTMCLYIQIYALQIAMTALSKAWVCGLPHAGLVGSGWDGSGWSLIQRNPAECGVSQCVRNASTVRTP